MTVRGGLRGRLLLAFVSVAVPPVALLAFVVTSRVSRSFEESAAERLDNGLSAVRGRIVEQKKHAEAQIAAVVREDLADASENEIALAHGIAQRRDLEVLEVLDREGRIVSSHHHPVAFGLPDRDGLFPGNPSLRIEKVGEGSEGYGVRERLALTAARPASWRGAPVVVRGGVFLDGDFLGEVTALTGMAVGLRDDVRRHWRTPMASPLADWTEPELGSQGGDVSLNGESYRWAAGRVDPEHPGLWVVVAVPRTELSRFTRDVGRVTLVIATGALLVAFVMAVVLSVRIARPVGDLAEAARRVASGGLGETIELPHSGEMRDLAQAFNQMSVDLMASSERLLQAERVAAWREMARRLAHELKNPLFPIQVSIETLQKAFLQQREGNPQFATLFRESSETILDELRMLRGIIDEFSAFARLPRPQFRPTDLNAVVVQVLNLYQAQAQKVVIEPSLASNLPEIPADRDLLARALGNLVANALEAMPGGGTLRVRTSRLADAVAIDVEDTGPGVTEEQRTRLFTPYFTTKKGGTGLGLAIVQSVVSDHGGRIEVRSEPGRDTTFTLILPTTPPGPSL